ncbi:hypothetical protein JCM3770_001401 [Rhodotorula araucariae]
MGVQGLWKIVGPVARPITLESLEDKRLAIDASIWLYQFQMAMRDRKTGDTLHGAHIMGTFRRILKLLFHGIKPVFVFDGDAPMLKKRTIEKRKRRKQGAGRDLAQTAQKLLSAQLRSAVAERELNKRRKEKLDAAKAAARADPDMDTGDQVGDDAVYLEDLDKPVSPVKAVRKDALRDEYALPRIEGPLESRAKMSDPRIATEEELRDFIDDLRPEDLDIESEFFSTLPTEVKYEILGDLRIKTRQVNHRRVQQMRGSAAIDFSRAQIDHLMERNLYTQKLLSVTDELGKSAIAIPTRVAGSRNREYVLVKQDASKGGGWVLGVKNPEINNTEPITIDTTTDESVGEHTDTDEFDEVAPPDTKAGLPTPDVEARRALAEEAVRARFAAAAPGPVVDPYLDQPVASTSRGTGLFQHDAQVDEDVALQQALYESAQAAVAPDHPRRPPSPLAPVPRPSTSYPSRWQAPAIFSRPTPEALPVLLPPPRSAGANYDTDDDLEYVDMPIDGSSSAIPAPPPAPTRLSTAMDTDDEGSDAFEEVSVAAPLGRAHPPAASASAPPAASATAPGSDASLPPAHLPSRAPAHQTAAPPTPSPPPSSPPAAAPSRGLLDSVLLTDSESEGEVSPLKPAPRPLPPAVPPAAPAFARPSPSPDPFERFEEPHQRGVRAVDFAAAPHSRSPPPPPTRLKPRSALPPPVQSQSPTTQSVARASAAHVVYEADLLAFPPVASAAPTPPTPLDVRGASPASLPAPLPLLEKAREAVEAEETGILPATVAQLGSPAPAASEGDAARREASPRPPPSRNGKGKGRAEEGQDMDELFFSDWSRSPSPPQRRGTAGDEAGPAAGGDAALESTEWYYDMNDEEEAEALQVLEREEEAFADVMAQLRNEKIEKMRAEAEKDVMQLSEQRNVEMRNADGVTRQMAVDIKEMLILFGIPYIDAPTEAEAECASLLTRELVDGIVTDDSDVFLFGGSRIYRNMFNESKYVECYIMADLEREIGLDRDKLVRLAYLLGSDYTEGLPGVGPVAGRELLEEFPGDDGLRRFREWWDRVQSGKDSELETSTAWKRRFKKGHKDLILDKGWPNPEIAQAYYRPTVDESNEHFSWGGVDLDGLRFYLNRSLGWAQSKSDSFLLPLIKREQERKAGALKKQPVMTDFFDYTAGYEPFSRNKQPKYASKRLQNVVQQWKQKTQPKGQSKADDEAEDAEEADKEGDGQASAPKKKRARKAPTAKAARPKKSTAASRKRAEKDARAARTAANGGEFSPEEDLRSDWEKEEGEEGQPAVKKTRTQPARRRKKVVALPLSDDGDE